MTGTLGGVQSAGSTGHRRKYLVTANHVSEQPFNEPPGEKAPCVPWRRALFCRRVLLGTLVSIYSDMVMVAGAFSILFLTNLWNGLGAFAVVLTSAVGTLLWLACLVHTRRLSAGRLRTADTEASRSEIRDLTLSLAYLRDLKRRSLRVRMILVMGILVFMVKAGALSVHAPLEMNAASVVFILAACLGLTLMMELVVEVRILMGWFGTTEWEARELLRFLIRNAADIDFVDDDGNRRRVLLPERPEVRQSASVGVSDGVTT